LRSDDCAIAEEDIVDHPNIDPSFETVDVPRVGHDLSVVHRQAAASDEHGPTSRADSADGAAAGSDDCSE
jgi:hypothetical protein